MACLSHETAGEAISEDICLDIVEMALIRKALKGPDLQGIL